MSDRFKFRLWESYANEMKYIDDLYYFEERGMHTLCDFLPDVIPMQCTGLKDKNGKLIYEGDIVKCGKWDLAARDSFRDDEYIEQVGVINYYNNRCRFVVNRTTIVSPIEISLPETCLGILGDCHIEVIGNIYENKELLEDTECQNN